MALEPSNHRVCLLLGATFERMGQLDAATEAYREALHRRPGWSEAQFFLSAVRSKSSESSAPAIAPAEYVAQLFDGYASTFEQHLLHKLKYRAPQLLFDALVPHLPPSPVSMIDLGCGTGLLGLLVRPRASALHGVDLSEKMLAEAQSRKLYDQLERADIVEALAKHDAHYDAVLAADVLVYVGDLAPLYQATAKALRPGGLFAFTVEENRESSDFRLQPSRRYAHAANYLRQLAAQHGLVERTLRTDTLRQQSGEDIRGHIVVFQKPTEPVVG